MKQPTNKRKVIGWFAVSISIVITCVWAFWGIIENFHEGWYFESWWMNLEMMLLQYLSPMLVFLSVTLISIFWPRLGSGLLGLIAIAAIGFFRAFTNASTFLIIIPLIGLGAMYWFGRPSPRKLAASMAAGLPMLTLVISGLSSAIRVSQRIDDGNLQAQLVHGNDVELIWAPDGPGWPREGGDWYEAQKVCQYLSEDGYIRLEKPQGIWRLPSIDEAVRSMALHGVNSGGIWKAETADATYTTTPDKESPLWNIYSQVIYWWTATEVDDGHAYIIVYDGKVWSRAKNFGPDYLGFRCVRDS